MHSLKSRIVLASLAVVLSQTLIPSSADALSPVTIPEARSIACSNLLLVDAEREPDPELRRPVTLDSCRELLTWHDFTYYRFFLPVLQNRCARVLKKKNSIEQVFAVPSDHGYLVSDDTIRSYREIHEFCSRRKELERGELLREIVSSPFRFEFGEVELLERRAAALDHHGEKYLELSAIAAELAKIVEQQFEDEILERAELRTIESNIAKCMTPASEAMMEGPEPMILNERLGGAEDCLERIRAERAAHREESERTTQWVYFGLVGVAILVLLGAVGIVRSSVGKSGDNP